MGAERAILLVEDEDGDAELATRAFIRANIKNPVVRARDGVEVLDYLFARSRYAGRDVHDLPLFVLLDLNIPKLNGIRVLEAIALICGPGIFRSYFLLLRRKNEIVSPLTITSPTAIS